MNVKLTRAKLEQLVDQLIQGLAGPCETALKDAGLKKEPNRRSDLSRRYDSYASRTS